MSLTRKYYEYFGYLSIASVLVIVLSLVVSIVVLSIEQRKVNARLYELVHLFEKVGLAKISTDNKKLTDFDMQVVTAWNNSVDEIHHQEHQREVYLKGMVHDLKTPIQILKSNVQMYQVDHGPNEYVESISEELEILEHQVLKYLIVEKINFFEKVNYSNENLRKYFTNAIERYQLLDYTIKVDYISDTDIYRIDRAMFDKITVNLIENAIKHGVGDVMWINVYNNKIEFINCITDLPAHEDLFSLNKRQASAKGNGLGIQIIKTYVELMKFRITSKCETDKLIVTLNF